MVPTAELSVEERNRTQFDSIVKWPRQLARALPVVRPVSVNSANIQGSHFTLESESDHLEYAKTVEDVVAILRKNRLHREADQFEKHLALHFEEIEEGDAEEVNLQSMILFARFLVTYNVSSPFIFVNYDGYVGMEWTLSDHVKANNSASRFWGEGEGLLVLEFLPIELIEFAMLSGPTVEGKSRLKLNGCVPLEDIEDAIRLITSEIFNDDRP